MTHEGFKEKIGQVVLAAATPGVYSGLRANNVGKKCVEALVDELKNVLSTFSAIEIVKRGYSIHEEYVYAKANPLGKIYFSKKYNIDSTDWVEFERATTRIGMNSRFLIESGIAFAGLSGIPSDPEMYYISKLVDEVVMAAKNLDMFYYSGNLFPNFKLEVTDEGELVFIQDEKFVKQKEHVIAEFALERKIAHSESFRRREETLELDRSEKLTQRRALYKKYSSIDEAYKIRFGYKFSHALDFLFRVSDLNVGNKAFGVRVEPRKKLMKKLSEMMGMSLEETEKMA